MNENERGITPPNVTAMTVERYHRDWLVTIEQGNGEVIKQIELTELERLQLVCMLGLEPGRVAFQQVEFVDVIRAARPG